MKTHTARWTKIDPSTWILKARLQDGGATLATITYERWRGVYWQVGARDGGGFHTTIYDAKRAVRAVLKERGDG